MPRAERRKRRRGVGSGRWDVSALRLAASMLCFGMALRGTGAAGGFGRRFIWNMGLRRWGCAWAKGAVWRGMDWGALFGFR